MSHTKPKSKQLAGRVMIRLQPDEKRKLERLAEKDARSVSQLARVFVRRRLSESRAS